jgi:hypothetical protein
VAKWAKQYRKTQGEYGTWIIEETGFCTPDEAAAIEAGCVRRYRMVPIPNAAGAVMKVLDGTVAVLYTVTPTTYGVTYQAVKVHGQVDPFAAAQDGGTYQGQAVLFYAIRYQQVGGLA